MRAALERIAARLRRLAGRDRFEADLAAEIDFHIETHAEELERAGLGRAEALRQARLRFGGVERYKEEGRDLGPYHQLDVLEADLRDAFRGLRRDRGFAVVAVGVIASVLAANLVLFAFLDAYFLRPLPIAGASRHVELAALDEQGSRRAGWPLAEATRIVAALEPVLERGYAFSGRRVVAGERDPRRAYAEVVSPSYFQHARLRLALGRPLSADPAVSAEAAVLLSHAGWQRLLPGEPQPLGKGLLVDGVSLTVVGVLAEGAGGLEPVTPDLWMLAGVADRPGADYAIGGLLPEGLSAAQASAAATPALRALGVVPGSPRVREALLEPRTRLLREARELRPLALSLLFLFGLVTAIAAANLTSLHLARATARRHDLSIRAALGASRSRLVRHLATEAVLVALLAAALAWGLAVVSVGAVQGFVFSLVSDAGMSMLPVQVGPRVVGAAFVLALLVGLGCGLLPALQATRLPDGSALKREAAWLGGRVSAGRLRGALVVIQVALSLPLLVGAGVLARSVEEATRVAVGFPLDGLVDVRPDAPSTALAARLRDLPGVRGVAASAWTPLTGDLVRGSVRWDGNEAALGTNTVDERFFETMGIAVRQGRGILPGEAASQAPVAVVSEATAQRLWPGRNPLGQVLEIEDRERAGLYRAHEVVGVASDVMSGFFFRGLDSSIVYRPGSLEGAAPLPELLVRVGEASPRTLESLKEACRAAGTLCEPFTLRRALGQQRVPFSVAGHVASALGLLALGLACLGLHGLCRFSVVQRTREFGVRLAIGATRTQILAGVLGESARHVARGIALGLPACLGLSALIATRVRILEPFDPASYSLVPLLLLAAALLASLLPALRAAGTDPIRALREE